MTKVVFFDDLYVGQPLRSESVEVTQEQIIRFARDNDPQYFHVDPEAAKESLFGGLIASGWQTGALTLRLLLDFCGLAFAGGVIGTDTRISWKRPVRPGDRLHIEGEITKLRPSRSQTGRGYVTFEASTYNQDGVAVQTIEATMLALRRPDRGAP
ncbi:MaoC family dehydratase [Methylocystis iwaonis]|uniref:MaoC family dehydratase n=1 Tax=Methylocystis iwaonis TaxID=2885079 RepID=UPI002E7B32FA|nr:MaoC family dehydratase [Methylocystis iwaonis]